MVCLSFYMVPKARSENERCEIAAKEVKSGPASKTNSRSYSVPA